VGLTMGAGPVHIQVNLAGQSRDPELPLIIMGHAVSANSIELAVKVTLRGELRI
jgi:hypothetical protein